MSKVTLKQKQYFVAKFTKFLSEHIGMYITTINGEKIDVQKEWDKFLKDEFNYEQK